MPVSSYFELLSSFKNESSSVVLLQIINSLNKAETAVITDASRPAFARYVRDVLRSRFPPWRPPPSLGARGST
jgi:hypothetical protein